MMADAWPHAAGEMAARIRTWNWAATPLGPIQGWPQSLRTAVDLVLASPFPNLLLWGSEFTVCAYNDAYRPLLGDKPEALGRSYLDVWSEARGTIEPQLGRAFAGEVVRFENAHFTLSRGGGPEEAWFDHGYGPVRDETGAVSGVLNTAVETRRVHAEQAMRDSEARFRALATAGAYMLYRMSPDWRQMRQLSGREFLADTLEPTEDWADAYLLDEDRPAIFEVIKEAIRTRSLFELEHRVRRADGGIGWVHSRAIPILGPDGEIVEWFGTGSDVTERREAQQRLREAEASYRTELERQIRERTAELQASRDLLQATMDASTDMIQVFEAIRDASGEIIDFRWVFNNRTSESKYGRIEGQSLLERNPGVIVEGIFDAFKRVTETGVPEQAERHYGHEQFDGWFYQSVVKLGDGVATTTKDITEWKAAQAEVLRLQEEVAQAKLRESEERLRIIVDNVPALIGYYDRELRFGGVNEEFGRFLGVPAAQLPGERLKDWLKPNIYERLLPYYERALAGERVTVEDKEPDKWGAGQHGWTEENYIPDVAPDGTVRGFFVLALDVSARKNAEEALRRSEERFRTIAESIEDVFYMTDLERNVLEYLSPSYERVWGRPASELMDDLGSFAASIHPDDRPAFYENKARQAHGEPLTVEYRIVRPDGEVRWIFDRSFPVASSEGRRAAGIASDITDRKRLQEHERLLLAELQHRVRNTLAVVRSIARRTVAPNDDLDDYKAHFDGRLGAFARAQAAVTRDPSGGVDLGVLLADELATNAVKYGALSLPSGGIDVRWTVERNGSGDELTLRWTENMPGAWLEPPTQRGFGLDLLERTLAYELGAATVMDFAPTGVRCTVVVPVSEHFGRVGR